MTDSLPDIPPLLYKPIDMDNMLKFKPHANGKCLVAKGVGKRVYEIRHPDICKKPLLELNYTPDKDPILWITNGRTEMLWSWDNIKDTYKVEWHTQRCLATRIISLQAVANRMHQL